VASIFTNLNYLLSFFQDLGATIWFAPVQHPACTRCQNLKDHAILVREFSYSFIHHFAPMQLSHRGQKAATRPLRADLDTFYEAMDNRYHPTDNPDGCFTLCIAENGLMWPALRDKMQAIATNKQAPDWVASYTAILGAPELREVAASFLTTFVAEGVGLNAEKLGIAAGAAAVIEMTALLIADAGDVAVIPGPAYMAYTPDLANKAEVGRYDLHRPAPSPPSPASRGRALFTTTYELTTAELDRAHAELGDRFHILLLTQPNNPTGQVFTPQQLTDFADWCTERKIHLVVNEIYALSLLDQTHPDLAADYPTPAIFTSFLPELERRQSPYLHWWYSFSKDFGISGFRLGMVYSHNELLLKAWSNTGAPSMSSNHSQWLLLEVLSDQHWVRAYVDANKQRITDSYALVIRTLRQHKVAYAPAAGSLFVWFNLNHLLTADTDAAELDLWQRMYDETGILLTSPVGQGSAERGWYRMVYSCVSLAELEVAMERLGGFLAS
jgi:aspartate/methionine/tyrosine aminotransferase